MPHRPNWYKDHPAACTCVSCQGGRERPSFMERLRRRGKKNGSRARPQRDSPLRGRARRLSARGSWTPWASPTSTTGRPRSRPGEAAVHMERRLGRRKIRCGPRPEKATAWHEPRLGRARFIRKPRPGQAPAPLQHRLKRARVRRNFPPGQAVEYHELPQEREERTGAGSREPPY